MPCFKGLAVSIHTPNGPLAEYSIQKNNRVARIATYIPVPQPQFSSESGRPEPSTFAISITLLVPGQVVPYSRPPPSSTNPNPEPRFVGSLPGLGDERGKYTVVGPYIPLTSSSNETIAAYIHFDGRQKEEVATLLRRGEETWVNSRWVSVPDSEGGGLAEREFLFREVGLERWLNGLDLKGETKEVAERIERRKQRLEKKRQKKLAERHSSDDDELDIMDGLSKTSAKRRANVLRYGEDKTKPIEALHEDSSFDDSDSEDEMPMPEAAGQIKVSLYRVLASGEVKRGEYSPQFGAHDDDDMDRSEGQEGSNGADVDHTTTFAKPKTLDPNTISTQTVTGIDPPDKPFATFTFFYRGKKQLQKMGILSTSGESAAAPAVPPRASKKLDASNLGSLKSNFGTVGFSGYRDASAKAADPFRKGKKKKGSDNDSDMDEDSDVELDEPVASGSFNGEKPKDANDEDGKDLVLSAEEVSKRGELADGVKKMQLKRQHSFEPPEPSTATTSTTDPAAALEVARGSLDIPPVASPTSPVNGGAASSNHLNAHLNEPSTAASPFKKARASVSEKGNVSSFADRMSAMTAGELQSDTASPTSAAPSGLQSAAPIGSDATTHSTAPQIPPAVAEVKKEDEEL